MPHSQHDEPASPTSGRQELSRKERDAVLRRHLPADPLSSPTPVPSSSSSTPRPKRRRPIRTFMRNLVHFLIYSIIHALFSAYMRVRIAYHAVVDRILAVLYYHHRTPELIAKDVKNLSRLPEHLSVILDFHGDGRSLSGLEGLVNDVSEISAWCASAGIPFLSIYEKTGILKNYIPQTHSAITQTLHAYFGASPSRPSLSLRAPNVPTFSPPETPPSPRTTSPVDASSTLRPKLTVLLISADDGRNTLVDLTKTLAEMAQRGKIAPGDISADLIDAEISESVMDEPDMLILFGERVLLKGYPPWQIRLSEIFYVPDNQEGVGYQVFLRALHRFAKAEMRFGR